MVTKYTDEQTEEIVAAYKAIPSRETVDKLAKEMGTSPRSIIGKLSRLGVYERVPYVPKYASKPVSKEEIVAHIGDSLGADIEKLSGLSKSQKPALLYLEELLVNAGIVETRE